MKPSRPEGCIGLQVLQQVYVNKQYLDDELVNSIVWPAQDRNAAEVFYRIITGEGTPVNVLLDKLDKVHSRWLQNLQGSCIILTFCCCSSLCHQRL